MFVFIKKRLRTPVITLLLVILLASSFSVLCFTSAYRLYVKDNTERLADAYTTIAVLNRTALDKTLELADNVALTMIDGEKINKAYDFVYESNYIKLDEREYLRAVLSDTIPLTSGSFNPLDYNESLDKPRNFAVFTATCINIEFWNTDFSEPYYFIQSGRAHYKLTFRVDETLLLHPDYTAPDVIYASHWAFDENGDAPFQSGKQYIIFGIYEDNPLITELDPATLQYVKKYVPDTDERLIFQDNMKKEIKQVGDYYIENHYEHGVEAKINGNPDTIYCTNDENIATFCIPLERSAASTIETNSFLRSWVETASKNISSSYVLTTNRLNSLLHFNTSKAWVIEGRSFTDAEAATGAAVCVIHKDFAVYNNLKIGDFITVDLFEVSLNYNTGIMTDNDGLREQDKYRGNLSIEVVGIYTAPVVTDYDIYQLTGNTIIMPSSAVPIPKLMPNEIMDATERQIAETKVISDKRNPALFTAIIPSNRAEDFRNNATLTGINELFIVSDQNYASVAVRLQRINDSAKILFNISLILLPVIILILAALTLRERHEIGLLLSLGMNAKRVAFQFITGWIVLLVVAMSISSAATAGSFNVLSKFIIQQNAYDVDYNDGLETASGDDSTEWMQNLVYTKYTSHIIFVSAMQAVLMMTLTAILSMIYIQQGASALVRKVE